MPSMRPSLGENNKGNQGRGQGGGASILAVDPNPPLARAPKSGTCQAAVKSSKPHPHPTPASACFPFSHAGTQALPQTPCSPAGCAGEGGGAYDATSF